MKLTDICQEFRALAHQAFLDFACACLAPGKDIALDESATHGTRLVRQPGKARV